MTRIAAVLAVALVFAGAALAASTGTTPGQIRAELVSPSTKIGGASTLGPNGTQDGSPIGFTSKITGASCTGLGKPAKGAYLVFSCRLTYVIPSSNTTAQLAVWARPATSTSVCLTQISVGACPPPPPPHALSGDPRACGQSYVFCVVQAADDASGAKLRAEHLTGVNYGCRATTAFVYKCSGTAANTALTVTFVPGKTAWSTVVQ